MKNCRFNFREKLKLEYNHSLKIRLSVFSLLLLTCFINLNAQISFDNLTLFQSDFGSNTVYRPAVFDFDNDGDLDILSGENDGNFYFLENIPGNEYIFDYPVTNPYGLSNIGAASSPTFIDLDGDGDMDMLSGDENGNFHYFENTNTTGGYTFGAFQTNPFGLANIGDEISHPTLFDIDNDNDLDIISGSYMGNFHYFENTGNNTSPSFGAMQTNPFGLSVVPDLFSVPTFVDLDNDGDIDIISSSLGQTYYFENTGTPASPNFNAPLTNQFGIISELVASLIFSDLDNDGDLDLLKGGTSGYSIQMNLGTSSLPIFENPIHGLSITASNVSPTLADLDNDGDLDLLCGETNGDLHYFENIGTSTNATFGPEIINPFGISGVSVIPGYSNPVFIDLDDDNDFDLMVGLASPGGTFFYLENIGNSTTPMFNSPTMNPFGLGFIPAIFPTFADLDNDGDQDLLCGSAGSAGEFYYYENTGTAQSPTFGTVQTNPFGLSSVPSNNVSPTFIDIDEDGDFDIVTSHLDSANNQIVQSYFENIGSSSAPSFAAANTGLGWLQFGYNPEFADLDNDGDMDWFSGFDNQIIFKENNSLFHIWNGNTSSDWNDPSNWSAGSVPNEFSIITIPTVSTNSPQVAQDLEITNIKVETGNVIEIASGYGLTANNGHINNQGEIRLNADINGAAYYDDFTNGGSFEGNLVIEQYIPSGGDALGQRLFSSPVNNGVVVGLDNTYTGYPLGLLQVADCATDELSINSPYSNLLRWDESSVNTCDLEGWVAIDANTTLTNGLGYSGWMNDGANIEFIGNPNSGDISVPNLGNSASGVADAEGWHLLGNPYPSPISVAGLNGLNSANFSSVSYYDGSAAFSGTFQPFLPGDNIGIAQSFTAHTLSNNTFLFDNSIRVGSSVAFKNSTPWHDTRLDVEVSGNGFSDKTYIYFNDEATVNFDNAWDCVKRVSDLGQPTLFTNLYEERLSLNGMHNSNFGENIPLGLIAGHDGEFTISVSGLETIPSGIDVVLYDKKTDIITNLSTQLTYTFNSLINDDFNRFEIQFADKNTGITDLQDIDNLERTLIYSTNSDVIVDLSLIESDNMKIKIFDLLGNLVTSRNNVKEIERFDFAKNTSGIYLVKLYNKMGSRTKKGIYKVRLISLKF